MSTDTPKARVLARYPDAVCVGFPKVGKRWFGIFSDGKVGTMLSAALDSKEAWRRAAERLRPAIAESFFAE